MNKEKLEKLQSNGVMCTRATSVAELLESIPGENYEREGLKETPWRVAKMYDELFWGCQEDPKQVLRDAMFEEEGSDEMVLVKEIPFYSMCEHHLMPIIGVAAVAYIPQRGKIVGLSKIARVVEIVARRPQVQERIGKEILEAMNEVLNPLGVAVIIQARHLCMEARGIQKPGAITVTSSLDGVFKANPTTKQELMSMMDWKANL